MSESNTYIANEVDALRQTSLKVDTYIAQVLDDHAALLRAESELRDEQASGTEARLAALEAQRPGVINIPQGSYSEESLERAAEGLVERLAPGWNASQLRSRQEKRLRQAIELKQVVVFPYTNGDGVRRARVVSPYEIVRASNGRTLLRGYDTARDGHRQFNLESIEWPGFQVNSALPFHELGD